MGCFIYNIDSSNSSSFTSSKLTSTSRTSKVVDETHPCVYQDTYLKAQKIHVFWEQTQLHNVIHVSWKQNCNAQHSAAVASPTTQSSARLGGRCAGVSRARHWRDTNTARELDGHGVDGGAYGSSGGDFRDL